MNYFNDLSPTLIPICALLIPIVAIIAGTVMKITRLNLLHETVRQINASGQQIPSELLNQLVDKK